MITRSLLASFLALVGMTGKSAAQLPMAPPPAAGGLQAVMAGTPTEASRVALEETVTTAPLPVMESTSGGGLQAIIDGVPERGFLESDHAFDGFIGPITNPVLSKDPRSLTEARFLFINNVLPPGYALGGGSAQVYALQLRAAVTERLQVFADKDGIARINTASTGMNTGLLNMNFGFKYLLVRDVENQFIWNVGMQYEPSMGYSSVFQHHGDGVMTPFTTIGKEINCNWHVLNTFGYQFGMDGSQNSAFFFDSLHIDRKLNRWLYALGELNWFGYTHGGDRGLPPALGEGDGLLNLGTSGVKGNNLVTLAFGFKAKLSSNLETGLAWEFPVTDRKDLIGNRLTYDLILRY